MIILGIDPSLNSTGWSLVSKNDKANSFIVQDCGLISHVSGGELFPKLRNIYDRISDLCQNNPVEGMAIEQTIVNKNAESSLKLGMVRGVCVAAAFAAKVNTFEYNPKTIKLAITGMGNASKEQVMFFVNSMIDKKLEKVKFDITDSVGIAIAHILIHKL